MATELSIVIPVYGSERLLPKLVDKLHEALAPRYGDGSTSGFEVILVNDCSPDASWSVITELARSRTWLKGVSLRKNAGQHNAILAGLRYARGQFIVTMDDDLQHDPMDVPKIVAKLEEGHDVCYSRFRSKRHAWWKRAGSAFNDLVANHLLSKPKGLYLSPFKGMTRGVLEEVVEFTGPYVYLDGLILSATNSVTSIELEHHARPDGASGYSLRKSVSLWMKMATSFSVAPLRMASVIGLIFSGFGFLAAIAFVIQRFTINAMPVGWSSLIVSILILGGIQLMALGIIGEYVGRILLHVNGRPQAVVGKLTNVTKRNDE